MPVTARLSKQFYDRLGEEIANELVEWFNAVDATYRADLRELNELNFSRFDAKLEQRLAEFSARLEQRLAAFAGRLEQVTHRLSELQASVDRRFNEADGRITALEGRTTALEGRITALEGKVDRLGVELTARIAASEERIKAVLEQRLAQQTRWLFGAWAALLVPIICLWFR